MRGSRSFSSPGGSRYASPRPGSSDYFPVAKGDARISISSSRSYSRGVTSNVGGGAAVYDAGAVEEACRVLSDESRVMSEVASHLTQFFVGLPSSVCRAASLCNWLFHCVVVEASRVSEREPSSVLSVLLLHPPPLLLLPSLIRHILNSRPFGNRRSSKQPTAQCMPLAPLRRS